MRSGGRAVWPKLPCVPATGVRERNARGLRPAMHPGGFIHGLLAALAFGGGCGGDPVDPAPVATAIAITPAAATLEDAGEKVQLTATVTDQNGQIMTDVEVTWSTGDSLIADVSETGLVVGGESGQATLRAALDTLSATATMTGRLAPEIGLLRTLRTRQSGESDGTLDLQQQVYGLDSARAGQYAASGG